MILTDVYMESSIWEILREEIKEYKKFKLPTKLNEVVIKEEYLEKKNLIIDKILDSVAYSEIPLKFTRDEFIAVLEKNI
ncbi:hypothetical protein [Cetobacterium sp.]|uniref:hypothetical protein n=1 Tax=Cetobacterium sp. TaxID=2071632 RepID=UPI003F329817